MEPLRGDAAPEVRPAREARRFRRLYPGLGVVSLAASCVLWTLRGRQVVDESYTHAELGDRSFAHLFHAVQRLGGGGMPLYYLTIWPWSRLFGTSDAALRLYSSLSLGLALVILMAALRRRFPAQTAFLGVAFGVLTSQMVFDENAQGRGYGLYVLLGVLAIVAWLRVASTARPKAMDMVLLGVTQAGLVLGHVLGLLYAGLMLLALIALDGMERRFRPRAYLCLMAGWLALLRWVPAIRASMAVGKPHPWIPMPTYAGLLTGLTCWIFNGLYWPITKNVPALMMLGWASALAVMVTLVVSAIRRLRRDASAPRAVLVLGLALVAAPVLFFLVSKLLQPIFVPRYMILTALGVALLAVGWFEQHMPRRPSVVSAIAACLLLVPVVSAALARTGGIDVAGVERIASGETVVCDWARDFLVLDRYSADPGQFQYVVDWPAALRGPEIATMDVHLMQNYRREGYYAGSLPDASAVLARRSFLLLDNGDTNWFQVEIAGNPRFAWKQVARLDDERRLLLVTEKNGSRP